MRLVGKLAIAYAIHSNLYLNKHADSFDGPRFDLTPEEAQEVCREDPHLIWVDMSDAAKPAASMADARRHRSDVRHRLLILASQLGGFLGRYDAEDVAADPFGPSNRSYVADLCRAHTQGQVLTDSINVLYQVAYHKARGRKIRQLAVESAIARGATN